MKRRSFLAAISCLPFLGWLKPKPENTVHAILSIRGKEFALGIRLTDSDIENRENVRLLADSMRDTAYEKLGIKSTRVEPRLTDPNDWFLTNTRRMEESKAWFDGPAESRDFDEMNLKAYVE